jgi:RES domain-containing protein
MPTPISLWRIAKETPAYKATDLSGGGAKITGGRWNSKGNAVVYTATTIALATLETLAHLGDTIAIRNAFLVRVEVPQKVWKKRVVIDPTSLDPTWMAEPPGRTSKEIGDQWIAGGSAALLLVPSVLVPEEFNVLINPAHKDASGITARAARQYVYDPRL